MEALLEKEGTVENWNDERLDELARRMDKGFEEAATKVELTALRNEVNLRFDRVDERFGEVDQRLHEVTSGLRYLGERFDRLQNTLLIGFLGLIAAVVGNGIWG
jgi:hypothetical protein